MEIIKRKSITEEEFQFLCKNMEVVEALFRDATTNEECGFERGIDGVRYWQLVSQRTEHVSDLKFIGDKIVL